MLRRRFATQHVDVPSGCVLSSSDFATMCGLRAVSEPLRSVKQHPWHSPDSNALSFSMSSCMSEITESKRPWFSLAVSALLRTLGHSSLK